MANSKVHLRKRKLKDGRYSLYLDTYRGPKATDRDFEFLRLYLTGNRKEDGDIERLAEEIRARRQIEYNAERISSAIPHYARRSFLDAFTDYVDSRPRSTKYVFRAILYHLRNFPQANRSIGRIDTAWLEDLQAYLLTCPRHGQDQHGTISKSTVRHYYKGIATFLHYALRQRWITEDPMLRARSIKVPAPQRVFLTIEEVRRLAATECRIAEIRRAFLFACTTGLRLSDIEKLEWSDIIENSIEMRQQKTQEPIYLPLSKQAQEILSTCKHPEGSTPVRNLNRVFHLPSRKTVKKALDEWAIAANVHKHVTFHVSRRTFATLALANGAELLAVSKYLGHTSLEMTRIYAQIVDDAKRRAAEAVPTFNMEE